MKPDEFIRKFTNERLYNPADLYQSGSRHFLLGPSAKDMLIKSAQKPEYAGTYLGRELTGKFIPSTFLLEMLRPHSRQATLSPRDEWLYVCRRDVASSGKDGDFLLVMNQNKEILGFGQVFAGKLRNLFDIGDFLRRETRHG